MTNEILPRSIVAIYNSNTPYIKATEVSGNI